MLKRRGRASESEKEEIPPEEEGEKGERMFIARE